MYFCYFNNSKSVCLIKESEAWTDTPQHLKELQQQKSGVLWKKVFHVAEILPKGASERQLGTAPNNPCPYNFQLELFLNAISLTGYNYKSRTKLGMHGPYIESHPHSLMYAFHTIYSMSNYTWLARQPGNKANNRWCTISLYLLLLMHG